jgi:hypothetical protein
MSSSFPQGLEFESTITPIFCVWDYFLRMLGQRGAGGTRAAGPTSV